MRQSVFFLIMVGFFFSLSNLSHAEVSEHIRVVGGEDASLNEFPSIVSVQVRSNHMCGGSLIAQNWVLTAAHCVSDPGVTPDRVFMGSNDLNDRRNGEVFRITQIIIHPGYGEDSPVSHDFALLKLHQNARFPIVELSDGNRDELEFNQLTVAGWGATLEDGFGSDTLQRVDLPFINAQACKGMMLENAPNYVQFIDNSMFCAGFDNGGKDSCQGDSGGPLYYWDDQKNEYIQAGVVSWGIGCARKGLPGMYGDVSKVRSWIFESI